MVTGSTGGLGRAVALMLAGPGTHIIVHGRNVERGQAVVQEAEAKGSTASVHSGGPQLFRTGSRTRCDRFPAITIAWISS